MTASRAIGVALVAWLAACTAGTGPSSPSPSVSPSPAAVRAFVGDGVALEPGRYRYDAFEPAMTFEVGTGWVGGHMHDEFFDVWRGRRAVVAFARPRFVQGDDGRVPVHGLDAREALEAIASIDDLEPSPIITTTVDGRPAIELRARSRGGVKLFGGDEGTFIPNPGHHRIVALDVDGTLVLIYAQIMGEPGGRLEPVVQDVIDSVRFEGSAAPPSFGLSGCPIDDVAACEALGQAARSLLAADVAALARLSRPDRFECEAIPADLFPACAEGGVLRGHPVASSIPVFEVLSRDAYRSRLRAILGNVDPTFADEHGSGAVEVLGVGTCGPADLASRSCHLGVTAAAPDDGGRPERLLGSLEFVHRDRRWWIGAWYLDTLAAWEQASQDPFSTIACGNMEAWG